MRSLYIPVFFLALLGAIALPAAAQAKNTKAKPAAKDPQDSIEVAGHIPASSGPVTRFLTTQHYSSYYLYAEHQGGQGVTMIDVTKAERPIVLSDIPVALPGSSDSIAVVAGTAALVTSAPAAATAPETQTIRIMDFSDPQHPKVTREFSGVTATSRDERRGLIFVANGEGIWILRQHLAEDPEVEKAYANYVVYGPSMYPPGK
jgi:hypothetical protein